MFGREISVNPHWHRKNGKPWDRKSQAEDRLIRLMERSRRPRPVYSNNFKPSRKIEVYMSDEVLARCGRLSKKYSMDQNKKCYTQKEIILEALSSLEGDGY